jgi:hypothetical protein
MLFTVVKGSKGPALVRRHNKVPTTVLTSESNLAYFMSENTTCE